MSRKTQRGKKRNIGSKERGKRKKVPLIQIFLVLVIILAGIIFLLNPYIQRDSLEQRKEKTEIQFKKEGELSFVDKESKQVIKSIDIEIAETEYERALGLMYRYSMSEDVGMLFVMELEEKQSFWMKETYISLDIIYLNKELEIVKIHKNVQPLSEESIPSIRKAKYVIEVVGGFCDKLNIEEGDFVKFERSNS